MFFWDGFLLLLNHTEKWHSQKCNLSFSGKNGKLIFHSNFLICDCNQLLSSFLLFLSPILFFFLSVLFALHCEWLHAICRCNPNDGLLALCNIRRHHHQQQQQTIPSTHTHRHGCHGYHNAPPSCPFAATSFPPPSPFPFPTKTKSQWCTVLRLLLSLQQQLLPQVSPTQQQHQPIRFAPFKAFFHQSPEFWISAAFW